MGYVPLVGHPRRLAVAVVLSGGVLLALLNAWFGLGGATLSNTVLPMYGEFVLAGAVVAIGIRAVTNQRDRWGWAALCLGAACWMAGDVYRQIAFPGGAHRYFPSPADAGYLLLYPCAYIGLWLLIRRRASRFQASLWLDGLIGAAGIGAVGATVLISVVVNHSGGSLSTVATNVAYPLADVLLVAQLVAAMALGRWRPGRAWVYLAAGLTIFALADGAYAYTSAIGQTYVVAIGPMWILAFVLIAVGAWQEDAPAGRDVRLEGVATLAVPLLFAAVAIGLLAYGQLHRLPGSGAGLAIVTLALITVRTSLTFRENLALLDSRRASLTDELTGLPNRRKLNQRADTLILKEQSPTLAGLLLLDLDGFKQLNDTLGHHAGDLLLEHVGARLAEVTDLDLVARLGGDEFAILVAGGSDRVRLDEAAERVHEVLDHPFELDDLSVHVRASIGGALCPEHGVNLTELMRHADVAMYSAKDGRTGYELYRPERDLNTRDRLRLVGELRRALRNDELVVFYQPKAVAGSQSITGVEALVRWEHPEMGLLTPDRFLDVAETAGLMRELTRYVLTRALHQLAVWNRDGAQLTVAVNLAMPNLLDVRLPEEVATLLAQAEVPPAQLTLEITENIVMADPARILDVVCRLHALGVRLSLDDFGAGASSLGYLKRLTVDELKIDRSFVMAMDHDADSEMIVRATIDLAHNLGLLVVAEGVETSASWQRLEELGCDEIQGYFLGRPSPPEGLASLLRAEPIRAVGLEPRAGAF